MILSLQRKILSVAELNEMRDAINQMRIERGAPKLIEEEIPSATEGEE